MLIHHSRIIAQKDRIVDYYQTRRQRILHWILECQPRQNLNNQNKRDSKQENAFEYMRTILTECVRNTMLNIKHMSEIIWMNTFTGWIGPILGTKRTCPELDRWWLHRDDSISILPYYVITVNLLLARHSYLRRYLQPFISTVMHDDVNSLRLSDAYMRRWSNHHWFRESLSPGRRQAIFWTNAGILLIGRLLTHFSEILIEI